MKKNKKHILFIANIFIFISFISAEITGNDLIFQNDVAGQLYSELNYQLFPSVISGIESKMLFTKDYN